MRNNINVAALCSELEQKLIDSQISAETLERYRKILAGFTIFACKNSYTQSLGADFLIARFQERGGYVSTDEHYSLSDSW